MLGEALSTRRRIPRQQSAEVGDHRLTSFGNPEALEEEVKRRIETMGDGGGFIAAPAYDMHSDVAWANIVAFSEAVDRYG